MSIRKIKKRRLKKYTVGDMRERIKVHTRNIQAPPENSAKFSELYDLGTDRWSFVETLDLQGSASKRFDNVELSDTPSHIFTIRFMKNISIENVIQWNGDYFKILAVQNPDGRSEYSELISVAKGDLTMEANQ